MKPTMLITGGSRGIGKACADYFRATHRVITVARSGDVTHRGDLTNPAFLTGLLEAYPTLQVLINNAGGARDGFRATAMLNFVAFGVLLDHYARHMQGGHIINITSNAAHGAEAFEQGYGEMWATTPKRLWYCAAKHAAKGLSEMLARACPAVKITNIEPGKVDSHRAGIQMPHVGVGELPHLIAWILAQPYQINTINFTPK